MPIPSPNEGDDITLSLRYQPLALLRREYTGPLKLGGTGLNVVVPMEGSLLLAALVATWQPGARQDALLAFWWEPRGEDREVSPADLEVPDDLDAGVLWAVHGIAEGAVAGIAPQRPGIDACDDAGLEGVMGDVVEVFAALDHAGPRVALLLRLAWFGFRLGSARMVWGGIFIITRRIAVGLPVVFLNWGFH